MKPTPCPETGPTLLDELVPGYDVRSRQTIRIAASPARVHRGARHRLIRIGSGLIRGSMLRRIRTLSEREDP
jgi:hypothetical protein